MANAGFILKLYFSSVFHRVNLTFQSWVGLEAVVGAIQLEPIVAATIQLGPEAVVLTEGEEALTKLTYTQSIGEAV